MLHRDVQNARAEVRARIDREGFVLDVVVNVVPDEEGLLFGSREMIQGC